MRLLGELNVAGCTYCVKLASPAEYGALDRAYGVCEISSRVIWVHEGMSAEKTLDTITHEAMHAFLTETGALHVIELAGVPDTSNLEEALVRVLTPHIAALFGPPQLKKVPRARRSR